MSNTTGIFERLKASTEHPSPTKPYVWTKLSDSRLKAIIGTQHVILDRRSGVVCAEVTDGVGNALAKELEELHSVGGDVLNALFQAALSAIEKQNYKHSN